MQAATSDVFDFTRDQLTVRWRDFDAPYLGGEIAFRASERWDVALGVGLSQSSIDSELWAWVDLDDNPIEQVTELRIVPVTLSAKYYLNDRGRTVGRFAWVPNTFAPYVGAGVGFASYRFAQVGDFVDEATLDIFYDSYVSDGWAPLVRGVAGLSVSVGKQFELSGEARYALSSADMGADFAGYRLGLNGFQAVFGIAVRF
jgi:outer membrane protein W